MIWIPAHHLQKKLQINELLNLIYDKNHQPDVVNTTF